MTKKQVPQTIYKITCPDCNGNKIFECARCKGTGFITVEK